MALQERRLRAIMSGNMVDLTEAEVTKACEELEVEMDEIEAEREQEERLEGEKALRRGLVGV